MIFPILKRRRSVLIESPEMNYIPAFITIFPFPIILNFKRFSALPGKGNVAQKTALNREFSVREF